MVPSSGVLCEEDIDIRAPNTFSLFEKNVNMLGLLISVEDATDGFGNVIPSDLKSPTSTNLPVRWLASFILWMTLDETDVVSKMM
jgi:hypothetical protein